MQVNAVPALSEAQRELQEKARREAREQAELDRRSLSEAEAAEKLGLPLDRFARYVAQGVLPRADRVIDGEPRWSLHAFVSCGNPEVATGVSRLPDRGHREDMAAASREALARHPTQVFPGWPYTEGEPGAAQPAKPPAPPAQPWLPLLVSEE